MTPILRRSFLRRAGLPAALLPLIHGLPSLGLAAPARPRQRLVIVFSPNGTIPTEFWPTAPGRTSPSSASSRRSRRTGIAS